jgi:hypothetical protein
VEIGEQIAVDVTVPSADDASCWYCQEPAGEDKTNKETAAPNTTASEQPDNVPENDERNLSAALGTALGNAPVWIIANPSKQGAQTTVVPAAHHLIPGEASLAKATALHKFMRKGGEMSLSSDIGYDVNDARNGVWLPGNYAVRAGNTEFGGQTWTSQKASFQLEYVRKAMLAAAGRLFHDAHRKYNDLVKQTLISIAGKIQKKEKDKCPICGKEAKDTRPPFGLVLRLHGVSGRHRSMVVSPTKKTVSAGYYTSTKAKEVFESE